MFMQKSCWYSLERTFSEQCLLFKRLEFVLSCKKRSSVSLLVNCNEAIANESRLSTALSKTVK